MLLDADALVYLPIWTEITRFCAQKRRVELCVQTRQCETAYFANYLSLPVRRVGEEVHVYQVVVECEGSDVIYDRIFPRIECSEDIKVRHG